MALRRDGTEKGHLRALQPHVLPGQTRELGAISAHGGDCVGGDAGGLGAVGGSGGGICGGCGGAGGADGGGAGSGWFGLGGGGGDGSGEVGGGGVGGGGEGANTTTTLSLTGDSSRTPEPSVVTTASTAARVATDLAICTVVVSPSILSLTSASGLCLRSQPVRGAVSSARPCGRACSHPQPGGRESLPRDLRHVLTPRRRAARVAGRGTQRPHAHIRGTEATCATSTRTQAAGAAPPL
eukprot:scaffold32399_cov77-Phaeocystis_antarctica.AAC.1